VSSFFCSLEIWSWNSSEAEELGGALETRSRRAMACSRLLCDVSNASFREGSVTISSIGMMGGGKLESLRLVNLERCIEHEAVVVPSMGIG
jgi:hypothetical protein